MSSVGFGLFKALIDEEREFSVLQENGLGLTHFRGSERDAYAFIHDHYTRYGRYPQLRTVEVEAGRDDAFIGIPDEPVEYWIDKVIERHKFTIISGTLPALEERLESGDIDDAVSRVTEAAHELSRLGQGVRIIDIHDEQRAVLETHDAVQRCHTVPGISFGFPYLDNISGGAQDGDFITIAGETGVGKTYLALRVAYAAKQQGRNVLFVSTELPPSQVARRMLAMQASIDPNWIKLGRLSHFARQRLDRIIEENEQSDTYLKMLPGGMFSSVELVRSTVTDYSPDLLIVDGAYLLRKDTNTYSRWERLMEIMEELKQTALSRPMPVIITHQYNRDAPNSMKGLAGTMAIEQLSSLVLSLEYERREDAESSAIVQNRVLRLLKGRDGESGSMLLQFDASRSSIEQTRVLTEFSGEHGEQEIPDDTPFEEI